MLCVSEIDIFGFKLFLELHTDNGQVDEAAQVKLANDTHMQRIDGERQACAQMPQNRLIEWCDGSVDVYFSDWV